MNSEVHVACQRPWRSLLITTSGDCYNCCFQSQPLGNLNAASIEEVWNGTVAQCIRKAFLQGEIPEPCQAGIGNCPELGRK